MYLLDVLHHLTHAFLCDSQLRDAEGQVTALAQARRCRQTHQQALKERVCLPAARSASM